MTMTTQAWVFLGIGWAVIIGMTGYCFLRMLTSQRRLDGGDE